MSALLHNLLHFSRSKVKKGVEKDHHGINEQQKKMKFS